MCKHRNENEGTPVRGQILAEDETLVADGHEQRYLYLVVSGEVAITKINEQGKTQQIALRRVDR